MAEGRKSEDSVERGSGTRKKTGGSRGFASLQCGWNCTGRKYVGGLASSSSYLPVRLGAEVGGCGDSGVVGVVGGVGT